MKVPKDIAKYMPSYVAGIRLIDLALQHILCRRDVRVRWQLKLWSYYSPEAIKNSKAIALPTCGTFSSGEFTEKPIDDVPAPVRSLLARAAEFCTENAPDREWFRDYYLLTGEHMILTDEGWCWGSCKESLLKDYPNEKPEDIILDEVNAPVEP